MTSDALTIPAETRAAQARKAADPVVFSDRGFLHVGGDQAIDFLDRLTSGPVRQNLTTQAGETGIALTALLTPQGKYLAEAFVLNAQALGMADGVILDVPLAQRETIEAWLGRYNLRDDVSLTRREGRITGQRTDTPGDGFADPRGLGRRFYDVNTSTAKTGQGRPEDLLRYHRARIRQGIPEGCYDGMLERSILAELNYDLIGAVDWQKGCFIGQEVTVRVHRRGLVRKRMMPIRSTQSLSCFADVSHRDGKRIGHLGRCFPPLPGEDEGYLAFALLPLDIAGSEIFCEDQPLEILTSPLLAQSS